MYLSGWLLTLFAYSLGLDCVARVWDVFFRDGEKMLLRTALAILKLFHVRPSHLRPPFVQATNERLLTRQLS